MQAGEPETELRVDTEAVALCDQDLVRDVCAVAGTVFGAACGGTVEQIRVSCAGSVYFVVASFPKGAVCDIAKSDLDTVADVNPLRVTAVSVLFDGDRLHVKIRVSSFDHPVTVTDTHLVRVVKRRRWGMF